MTPEKKFSVAEIKTALMTVGLEPVHCQDVGHSVEWLICFETTEEARCAVDKPFMLRGKSTELKPYFRGGPWVTLPDT